MIPASFYGFNYANKKACAKKIVENNFAAVLILKKPVFEVDGNV